MDTTDPIQHLSDRERDILALIAKGRTNAEIGDALGLRFDTVKWYVSEILGKLNVDSREQAADAWRAYRRPQAMVSRRMRALIGLPLAKVGMGAAGTVAAGGVVVASTAFAIAAIAGLTSEASPNGSVEAASTPQMSELLARLQARKTALEALVRDTAAARIVVNPDITPPSGGAPRPSLSPEETLARIQHLSPDVDIVSASLEGRTFTFGMYRAPIGLCQYAYESTHGTRAELGRAGCGGPVTEPQLLSIQGVASHGPAAGIASAEMVSVRLRLHGGSYIELDTVPAPAELGVPWRLWIYAGERPVVGVEGLDAAGNIVQSRGSLAPLNELTDR